MWLLPMCKATYLGHASRHCADRDVLLLVPLGQEHGAKLPVAQCLHRIVHLEHHGLRAAVLQPGLREIDTQSVTPAQGARPWDAGRTRPLLHTPDQ